MTEETFKDNIALGINLIEQADEAFRPRLMRSLRVALIESLDLVHISDERKSYFIHLITTGNNLHDLLSA